jgi:hypothetical protein
MAVGTASAWAVDNPLTKPIHEPYFEIYAWERRLDREAFDRVARHLPPDASLSTMMAYGPHLCHRQQLYLFYDKGARGGQVFRFPQTDYLLLNLDDTRWHINHRVFYTMIEAAIGWYDYEVIALDGDVVLLQRQAAPRPETADALAQAIARWEENAKHAPVSGRVVADIAQLAQRDVLPPGYTPFDLHFGPEIELVGARSTPDELNLDAERVVTVSLYWRATQPIDQDYVLFVHLTDASGWVHVQRDTGSGWGFNPTSTWPQETLIEDMRSLPLPPHLPPGEYRVRVGWYAQPDVRRLPVIQDGQVIGDVVDVSTFAIR